MRKTISASIWLASVALVAGCGTMGGSGPAFHQVLKESIGENGRACIRHRDIRGYGVLDRDVVSIDARNRYYLATVMPGCQSLSTSPRALFEERFSEVCGGGRDRLHTRDDHCTIRQIFEFEDRDAAFAAHKRAMKRYEEEKEAREKEQQEED